MKKDDEQIPEFAVFRNSRTLTTAVWSKEKGYWIGCNDDEYPAMLIVENLLRFSPNPASVMQQIAEVMQNIDTKGEENEN